jgi:pimeloyl-ACP methyl ester carboxylesterase
MAAEAFDPAPTSDRRSLFGTSGLATTRDGRRLHYVADGTGSPTVVFEAGMGSSHRVWGLVQPEIARHARTVVYDRAGYGRSPRDAEPRGIERLVGDLRDLLRHLGSGPFVLVAHSWGGPIVRLAASLEPEAVRGLVLVDPSDEGCDLYFTESTVRQQRIFAALLPFAAWTGLLRIAVRRLVRPLPGEVAAELALEDASVGSARTMRSELVPFTDDMRRLRERSFDRPEIPMTVISGALLPKRGAAIRAGIVDAHARRAASLPHGRHVRAERSGHYVLVTEPDVVVREILAIVRELAPHAG